MLRKRENRGSETMSRSKRKPRHPQRIDTARMKIKHCLLMIVSFLGLLGIVYYFWETPSTVFINDKENTQEVCITNVLVHFVFTPWPWPKGDRNKNFVSVLRN